MITVPNVVGAVQATAQASITSAGLTIGTINQINSATVPTGDVISQNPVAGTSIATGSPVNLEISLGPLMITVPNLVGVVQATAESNIIAIGLTVGTITTANSATVATGNVISQNPAAGVSIATGSPVNLEISLGPVMITVPNLVGNVQATAQASIISAGLTVGAITTTYSSIVPVGYIIGQNPVAGASAAAGSSVGLVVSIGPIMVTAPDLAGLPQATAESTITASNLTVGAITTANSATVATGNVISQNPVAGTTVSTGSSVGLVVSLGPLMITVPNVVGAVQATAQATITSAGLAVGTITQINSATIPTGNVINQNPAAGASIATGSPVNLEISLGPLMITVPNLAGLPQATAESTITASNLTGSSYLKT